MTPIANIHSDKKMSNSNKTQLPSTSSRFAWAKADRTGSDSYFRELTQRWKPLDRRRKELEAIEAALVLAAAEAVAAAAVVAGPIAPSMKRNTVRPPKHLIYRTGMRMRKNKP